MNETARSSPLPLLGLLLVLLLAACASEAQEAPLKGARMGGAFTLTSHEGRRVSSNAFNGKYRLVYFGFTFCPDVCPTDLQMIGAAMRQFEQSDPQRAGRVQPIFITTDPQRDTPEVMRRYVANFHPRLIGLTGSPQEIGQVARAHGVFFSRVPTDQAGNYTIYHSRMAVLYGPEGEPISIVPHDQGPGAIVEALDQWVQ